MQCCNVGYLTNAPMYGVHKVTNFTPLQIMLVRTL